MHIDNVLNLITNSPPHIILIILGAVCTAVAIIGKIPPVHVEGFRALLLAALGIVLVALPLIFPPSPLLSIMELK